MSDDLTAQCEYVAETLFGRERRIGAPDGEYWCLSAEERHGDKRAGPWFRYAGQGWCCADCYEDEYLSETGGKYLLGPAGMLEVIEKMRERGMPMHCGAAKGKEWWAKVDHIGAFSTFSRTLPEAVIRAAYKALKEQPSDA